MIEFIEANGSIILLGLSVWLLTLTYFFWKIYNHYKRLIGRTRKNDLISILDKHLAVMDDTKGLLSNVTERLETIEKILPNSLKKVGLVRFNPYRQIGGNQSFALSILDEESNGVVISALHSRDSTRVYAKPVVSGKETKYNLSSEEKESIKIAKSVKSKK